MAVQAVPAAAARFAGPEDRASPSPSTISSGLAPPDRQSMEAARMRVKTRERQDAQDTLARDVARALTSSAGAVLQSYLRTALPELVEAKAEAEDSLRAASRNGEPWAELYRARRARSRVVLTPQLQNRASPWSRRCRLTRCSSTGPRRLKSRAPARQSGAGVGQHPQGCAGHVLKCVGAA